MELKGFAFSVVEAAIKKPGRKDLALIFSRVPAACAAVFTNNKVKAAPVLLGMERAAVGSCRAVVVNSGNANACTGQPGMESALETARLVAEGLGIDEAAVIPSSTGVIGVQMPMDRVRNAVPPLLEGLGHSSLEDVAKAIMTTDTFAKLAVRKGMAGGVPYTIAGVAKGAGMIRPDMATMLSFLVTDAAVEQSWLQEAFRAAVDVSFNCITVDGDTSTNDTALIMANGLAGNPPLSGADADAAAFRRLLDEVTLELAKAIVKDGEGATKLVTIDVRGAANHKDARLAGMAVANSPLVKTAFFGQDANWGRILAAVGYSGAEVDQSRVALSFDDVRMVSGGLFVGGDAETRGSAVLHKPEFRVTIDLGLGEGRATVYTSDFSYDYVKINADYRT
ncbi:MAG: bifunctional glutamate N-acetyltransferase/amino-acid acetyltransferase ArgJ [Geobacter sp.]|nr:bifunctional glutamate N-acetyltransferase/amino-acid acetyltransferase ArgJ [Geobacter sp.]